MGVRANPGAFADAGRLENRIPDDASSLDRRILNPAVGTDPAVCANPTSPSKVSSGEENRTGRYIRFRPDVHSIRGRSHDTTFQERFQGARTRLPIELRILLAIASRHLHTGEDDTVPGKP